MSAVGFCFLEEFGSCFRDVSVKLLEVFDLSEQSDEDGVKVDLQQSIFFVLVAFVIGDKEVLQFFVGVLIDFLLPQSDLGLFIILDDLKDVLVELIDILVLLPLSDALAE